MEKHEVSKIDFELIDDAFKALLKSEPDSVRVAPHLCLLTAIRALVRATEISKECAWQRGSSRLNEVFTMPANLISGRLTEMEQTENNLRLSRSQNRGNHGPGQAQRLAAKAR